MSSKKQLLFILVTSEFQKMSIKGNNELDMKNLEIINTDSYYERLLRPVFHFYSRIQ